MKTEIKSFQELSATDLYHILDLRNQVFVVEQNCAYLDTDGCDQAATHVLIWNNDEVLVAYARVIAPDVKYKSSSIGRVVVHASYRAKNIGHLLMKTAVQTVFDLYKTGHITISAQAHLQKFYNQHGFVTSSEVYLEDNIPHVQMVRT
ncbi:GNAT family N-acetyltransferase [Flavobacterium sp. CBA20B-1]|uniref:GNAT family N-acetyltransferase n=1 Tax=unclassified Flavobacterium TaxID=196869 RepID=UPI002224B657|nr:MULTISPECIES: GNAT family N-acetyltransferase [unclassified Flavobacterium]WCM41292.1 GNAT family N-acetyltransferase [Flavobacterium sp. CBA20B-1]